MKPKPFKPIVTEDDKRYVRDEMGGLMWHRCLHRTLYVDTDRSGAVYHAKYLHFFEFGRASLMRETAYPYKEVEESGFIYPIIEIGVSYIKPLYYDDPMWIHTRPSKRERVRLQFDYVILHAETEEMICTGFTRHCALNASGKPVAIDEKTAALWINFPK